MSVCPSDCGYSGSRESNYRSGCRCDACRAAFAKYRKQWRATSPRADIERAHHAARLRDRRAAGESV